MVFLCERLLLSAGAKGKGAVVAALNEFGREHNNEQILELARQLLAEIMTERNVFVYEKYRNNPNLEYVSFAAIDRARSYTRYRYVRVGMEATMSYLGGGVSYVYTVGSDVLKRTGEAQEVTEQTDPYIRGSQTDRYAYLDEKDAKQKLDVRAEYIMQSNYAVFVTGSMEKTVQEVIRGLEQFYENRASGTGTTTGTTSTTGATNTTQSTQ